MNMTKLFLLMIALPVYACSEQSFTPVATRTLTEHEVNGITLDQSSARSARGNFIVPETSVINRGGLDAVFVIDETSESRLRMVKPGKKSNKGIEILSGLKGGEVLVVSKTDDLFDGSPVHVNVKP